MSGGDDYGRAAAEEGGAAAVPAVVVLQQRHVPRQLVLPRHLQHSGENKVGGLDLPGLPPHGAAPSCPLPSSRSWWRSPASHSPPPPPHPAHHPAAAAAAQLWWPRPWGGTCQTTHFIVDIQISPCHHSEDLKPGRQARLGARQAAASSSRGKSMVWWRDTHCWCSAVCPHWVLQHSPVQDMRMSAQLRLAPVPRRQLGHSLQPGQQWSAADRALRCGRSGNRG